MALNILLSHLIDGNVAFDYLDMAFEEDPYFEKVCPKLLKNPRFATFQNFLRNREPSERMPLFCKWIESECCPPIFLNIPQVCTVTIDFCNDNESQTNRSDILDWEKQVFKSLAKHVWEHLIEDMDPDFRMALVDFLIPFVISQQQKEVSQ